MANEVSLVASWTFVAPCTDLGKIVDILLPGERVICAYKTIRDIAAFTDKRLIVSDTQGITGKKTEIYSLPYKSINMFSVENAGVLDMNSEVELWTRAGNIKINLKRGCDVNEISRTIATYIL